MKILTALAFMLLFMAPAAPAPATEQFAMKTGLPCAFCHENPSGGGTLTTAGQRYKTMLSGKIKPPSPIKNTARFIVGYLHILAGIIWFGAIFYVHIILKPAYAARGLPKGELVLGWVGIIVVGITGIFLTISVMPSFGAFFHSRFGILLSIKIFLYLIMAASAAVVTFVIGPRLKKRLSEKPAPAAGEGNAGFTPDTLSNFDGREGRKSYAAVSGTVYDLTQSPLWKNGKHARHIAGTDLTAAIKQAPHGPEKLEAFPKAGTLLPSPPVGEGGAKRRERGEGESPTNRPKAVFYFMAYMNLAMIFLVIAVIALWRWWP